jgi:CHAT domain-containing protein/Tfp pilus assembly protein PilF
MPINGGCARFFVLLAALLCAALGAQDSQAQNPSAHELHYKQLVDQASDLYEQKKYPEAILVMNEAAKAAEAELGPDDARVAMVLNNLGMLYMMAGKFPEAEVPLQRAIHIEEKALPVDDPNLATALSNLATAYKEQHKYAEAVPVYERALIGEEKKLGLDSPDLVPDLGDLRDVELILKKYADAEPVERWILRIKEKTAGPASPELGPELSNLGQILVNENKYAEAEAPMQRLLRIEEKDLGPEDPALTAILNFQAMVYVNQKKYADAELPAKRSLRLSEKASGPDQPDPTIPLGVLTQIYEEQGKFGEAAGYFRRVVSIDEKKLGPESKDIAPELNKLAGLCYRQGNYADAEQLYHRALRIDEKALGANDLQVALELNDLAQVYDYQGRFAEAEPLHLRALHIREAAPGPESKLIAISLGTLALHYDEQGKYGQAEPLLERALRIEEKVLKPGDHDIASTLNNLAVVYTELGKYAEAEPLIKRALSIDENSRGKEHPDVASDLNNLAELYEYQDRYADAEPILQRALSIREKTLGPDHAEVAGSLQNLAVLYTEEDKYAEAAPLFERAVKIDEKALGADHPNVADDLENLASLDEHLGKLDLAETLHQRALNIDAKALGPDYPDLAKILSNFAVFYDDQGKFAQAKPLYQRAIDNVFEQFQYGFTYMTEKERLGFLSTVSGDFPGYFSFVHRYHEQDPSLIGSMYDVLLWEKGFIAGSIANMRHQVEASGDAEALKLLGQLTEKRSEIAALLNTKPADSELWRKQVDKLRAEAAEIEKALVARSSAFATQKTLDRATWQQVRDALRPGEAAVEFVRFQYHDKKWSGTDYYVALVLTPETKVEPQYIFLGDSKQIEGDAIKSFQKAVRTRGFEEEPVETTIPGAQAYAAIWKPLEPALAGKTRVYLSADGALNEIPLGIIPAPDGKLLMESYDLRLLSSTKDILRAAPARAANTGLLVGDPLFDLTEEQQTAAMQKLKSQGPAAPQRKPDPMLPLDARSRDMGKGSALPRLPGTGAEVSAIANLMRSNGWKTSVYTENLALKRVVEQSVSPRIVHLATHGFFLPDQKIKNDAALTETAQASGIEDPMLRSGLFFAGANRTLAGKPSPEGLDNGVLTAMEAGNLNLTGTELVVLSACNTGQGDVQSGEGVFGLRRAFEEAGAQSILMSLWSVPDEETQELMKSFYSKWLSGTEKHEALRLAQLEVRAKVKASHNGQDLPFYWGAFVLVGR